jgi:hypothetical protein
MRVGGKQLRAIELEEVRDGGTEIGEALFTGFALAICARDFEAGGPEASFIRLAAMENCREFRHGLIITVLSYLAR